MSSMVILKAAWSRVRAPITALSALALALALGAGSALAVDGDLDPTFGGDGKVTTAFFQAAQSGAVVYAIAVQTDGKIVAAGSASDGANNNAQFALARYNADGGLDTTFSGDGKLTTEIFGGQDYAYAVAVQADGKIVAAGSANINAASSFTVFALVRYNANGSLDTTFGSGGIVSTDFFGFTNAATSLALQADGKIVVAGIAHDGVADRFALARYNVNGSLDTAFGTGGKVSTSFFGFGDGARAVALQADGKIVAVGDAYPGGANTQFALARYNADGSLDASFGTGGKVTTDFFGANDFGISVALLAGGKIMAAGNASVPGTGIDHVALARYNADGSLDATFGAGGKTTAEFSSAFVRRWSAVAQADGKIVATSWGVDSASGFDHFLLVRFDTNGNLDSTFSGDGRLTTTFLGSQNQAYAIAVQANGKIVAAGSAFDPSTSAGQFALARYQADGNATPGVTLSSVSLSPTSVTGGNASNGTVTLSAAPSADTSVTLTSNNGAVTLPSRVTVAAGTIAASFTVTTSTVTTSTTATISATSAGVTQTAVLTVNPAAPAPPPAAPSLISPAVGATVAQPITFDWSDVAGAMTYEIQIDDSSIIAAPFRANQIVNVSQVTITGLPAQRLWWRVRGINAAGVAGAFSSTRRFSAQAAPAPASLSAVSVNPTSVVGGNSSTGTVTLTAAAPTGGAVVTLSDNSAAATLPTSVTIAAGATNATFTVTTNAVTTATTATITGSFGGVTQTATLTVNSAATGTLPAPSLLSPAADARFAPGTSIAFDWSDVTGAASYTIEIDDTSPIAAPLTRAATVTASAYTTNTLPTARMWWRVRANDASGNPGAWSPERRFEIK